MGIPSDNMTDILNKSFQHRNVSNSSNATSKLSDYLAFNIGTAFNLYYPPIVIIFGTIGNVISFVVFKQRSIREKSFSLLMRALALSDTGMLVVVFFTYWLHSNFTVKISSMVDSRRICVAFTYIVYVFSNCSHYLLCGVTVSRLIAVAKPLKAKVLAQKAKKSIFYICVGCGLKNLHYIWSTDYAFNPNTKTMSCSMGYIRREPVIIFLRSFETFVSSIGPCLIIILANVSIVYYLHKAAVLGDANRVSKNVSRSVYALKQRRENNITSMVLVVSLCFLVLAVPLLIHHLYVVNVEFKYDVEMTATLYLSYNICQKLWYTNNAVNFYIYALVGKEFRKNMGMLLYGTRSNSISPFDNNRTEAVPRPSTA